MRLFDASYAQRSPRRPPDAGRARGRGPRQGHRYAL